MNSSFRFLDEVCDRRLWQIQEAGLGQRSASNKAVYPPQPMPDTARDELTQNTQADVSSRQ